MNKVIITLIVALMCTWGNNATIAGPIYSITVVGGVNVAGNWYDPEPRNPSGMYFRGFTGFKYAMYVNTISGAEARCAIYRVNPDWTPGKYIGTVDGSFTLTTLDYVYAVECYSLTQTSDKIGVVVQIIDTNRSVVEAESIATITE